MKQSRQGLVGIAMLLCMGLSLPSCSSKRPKPKPANASTKQESTANSKDLDGNEVPVNRVKPNEDGQSASATQPFIDDGAIYEIESEGSLRLFSENVHPILQSHCVGCHGASTQPLFAQEDPQLAMNALLEAKKVDFIEPDASGIIVRLRDNEHNCWSADCVADGTILLEALTKWTSRLEAVDPADLLIKSEPIGFGGRVTRQIEDEIDPMSSGKFVQDFDPGTLANGIALMADGNDGEVTQYLIANARGTVQFTIDIPVAGEYVLWARVQSPDDNANRLRITIDDLARQNFTFPDTAGAWSWERMRPQANADPQPPVMLAAGPHTVLVELRDPGVMINQIGFSKRLENFEFYRRSIPPVEDLTIDLEEQAPGWKLIVEVEDFGAATTTLDEGEEESEKSPFYRITNLRAMGAPGSCKLSVASAEVLINGKVNLLHKTFRGIQAELTANGEEQLLSPASGIVFGEEGFATDMISIGFAQLECN